MNQFIVSREKWLMGAILLLAFVVHFYPFAFSDFHFINYDDEIFITPMLKLGLNQYFSSWLPQPQNYAYPLRDLTFFADEWLSKTLGIHTFILTNFLLFALSLIAYALLAFILLPHSPLLRLFFMVVMAFHPLNCELVQWASTRKNILPPLFIAWGHVLLFARWSEGKGLGAKGWLAIVGLQLASLACYPVTLLWLPLVLVWQRRFLPKRLFYSSFIGVLILSALYLRFAAPSGSDFEGSFRIFTSDFARVLYFFIRSLGRGFFNILWPTQLAIYYDSDHIRSFLGFAAFLLYALVVALLWRKVEAKHPRKLLALLAALVMILMLPQAHVFLSFADFRWADRYTYIVAPYFLLFNIVLLQSARPLKGWLSPLVVKAWSLPLALLVILGLGGSYAYLSRLLVPQWRSEMLLEDSCALGEGAPKCIAIMMSEYFIDDCMKARGYINLGAKRFHENRPPYSSQFINELPFYDATCIALAAGLSPQQKLEALPYLFDKYEGSPGPIFGIVLSHLEAKETVKAWQAAASYYHSGRPEQLGTSKLLVEIYLGQGQALCEIIGSDLCWQRHKHFVNLNPQLSQSSFPARWGYKITKFMHERGQGQPGHLPAP